MEKIKKKSILTLFASGLLCFCLGAVAHAEDEIENGTKVGTDQEITYYIDVNYDGKDEDKSQTDTAGNSGATTAKVHSGYINVEDKIPDGMEFVGFSDSENSIGAVSSDDQSCHGYVIDDNDGATGWDEGNQNYSSANGLHYNASDRTVRFKVNNLQAGGKLTVGVVVKTPSQIDDLTTEQVETRRDFYNYATAQEESIGKSSNMVHLYMGDGVPTYKVDYEYTGTLPENPPALPGSGTYSENASVQVADPVSAPRNYTFEGWEPVSLEPLTVSNNQFSMPANNVKLLGRFVPDASSLPKVTYVIEGTKPENYEPPSEKNYYEGSKVTVDSLKSGDTIADYVFSGWTPQTTGIAFENETETTEKFFTMPGSDVVIKGNFTRRTYTVSYAFYEVHDENGEVIEGTKPENADEILSHTNLQPTTHYENDIVPVASVPITVGTIVGNYKFLGWDRENNFTMPAEDVVIRGEWMRILGTFTPQISKEIVNKKDIYEAGDTVEYKITVTNPENFAITNVTISENNDRAKFNAGAGYDVIGDHLVEIPSMPANSSVVLSANYVVSENDSGTIENEVEFVSGIGENGYVLNDGEYKARSEFNITSNDPELPEDVEEESEHNKSGNEDNISFITDDEQSEEQSFRADTPDTSVIDSTSTGNGVGAVSSLGPKTGDEKNTYVYVAIAFISLICFAMVSKFGKLQKRSSEIH